MEHRVLGVPIAIALVVWASRVASGAPPDRPQPVTDTDLASDARLSRPVTILCARLHVGDLAERIAGQTGLPITADDSSGAADRRIMVSVRGLPAWKVMAGLTGLLSYKMALWQWERIGDTGAAAYRLVRTRGAQSLAQRLAEQAQSEFEDLAFRRMRDTYRTAQQWTERLADPTPVTIEERSGWGLQIFNATLPEDAQKSVLRGEVKARVPTSRLPPWWKRLVEDLYNRGRPWRRLPDGSTAPGAVPGRCRGLYVIRARSDSDPVPGDGGYGRIRLLRRQSAC